MLVALKELDFHVLRMGRDFSFGEMVQERNLEKSRVEEFHFRFDKILYHLIELSAITKGESKEYVTSSLKAIGKCKADVMKLVKEADFINDDITSITNRLSIIIDRKKKTVEDVKFNTNELLTAIKSLESKHKGLSDVLPKITSILEGNYEDTPEDIDLLNEDLKQVYVYINDMKIKNKHLEQLIFPTHKKLDDTAFLLKDESELELEDFVYNEEKHGLPIEVIEEIAKKIHITRDSTMFEGRMKNGIRSMTFKNNVSGAFELFTYGTDKDLDLCREAIKNGVDFVAKKGILQISHNTFDLVLNFLDSFTFFTSSEFLSMSDEETDFNFIFNRSIPKSNAYVLFNIPYFKIPTFMRKIRSMLTIESLYKVDDEIKNVLFICRYKQNNRNDSQAFTKALLQYDKLPHYSEMKKLKISGGEITHPKSFRPYFVDSEDIIAAFKLETPTFDIVEKAYQPKEKVIELNRPLQEYREGHLPAVATIEIVNGIYDIGEEVDFPNIYSTKIVQQDVEEEVEEMYKGEKVKVISQKKKNVIVSKILLPNGEIVELLNTK